MIGRRKFLGFMAAAPAAANAAVNNTANEMALHYGPIGGGSAEFDSPVAGWTRGEILKHLAAIKTNTIDKGMIRNVTRLDPDLAYSKSMSMAARIRIQAERNAELDAETSRAFWQHQLDELIGK